MSCQILKNSLLIVLSFLDQSKIVHFKLYKLFNICNPNAQSFGVDRKHLILLFRCLVSRTPLKLNILMKQNMVVEHLF